MADIVRGMGEELILFHLRTVLTAGGLQSCHALFNAGLDKECALLVFTQHTRTLVLLLKAAQGAVNCFVALDGNADHRLSST